MSLLKTEPLQLFSASQELWRKAESQKTDSSFSDYLLKKIKEVDELQKEADSKAVSFALGKTDNIHEVMIAAEKASLALQMTVQVRNKAVEAYQELSRMQI